MAELKTKKTEERVGDFLKEIKDEQTRQACFEIAKAMKEA